MRTILLVCTGNTCRSSMAEALLKQLMDKADIDWEYNIKSAGTSVYMSRPASANAIAALEEVGIDLSSHLSQQVTEEMLSDAELILTMTASHKHYLAMQRPDAADRMFTLKEYCCGINGDISDPFGGDLEDYIVCRDEIKDNLVKLVNKIITKE